MVIASAEVLPVRIKRTSPLALAYATRTHCRSVLVHLSTADETSGWGEAVPVAEVTHESYADVVDALNRTASKLIGMDPHDTEPARLILEKDLATLPSARNALDTALLDLKARILNVPLRKLLGGAKDNLPAGVTLGLDATPEEATAAAQDAPILKLKVGGPVAAEKARLAAIRAAVGEKIDLLVDANQAYSATDALRLADACAALKIALLEQPVPAKDLVALAEVCKKSPVPVCADEAVIDPASLRRVIEIPGLKMVNIKLQKVGGPSTAAWMIRTAELAGVTTMIGCMLETRVGLSAGLALALGCANVSRADLDGDLGLEQDPVKLGGLRRENGRLLLPDRPGLGVELDHSVLAGIGDPDPVGAL